MFDTAERAYAVARRLPFPGMVCELVIPEDAPVRIEKTLGPGHYTVWGDPAVLRRCVRGMV